MSFFLRLFGGAALEGEEGAVTGPAAQRHRLALLALLATSPSRALTRDKLMALMWPERDAEHARNLLNQSVYVLRKALGEGAILSPGEELKLDPRVVECDVIAFNQALAAGEHERAAALYTGPFLDGFFLDEAPEFERWADRERERLAGAYAKALEDLAEAAEGREDFRVAAEWWKKRAAHDPYDSRAALRLMQALEAGGNPAGALRHAARHERLLREDLGIGPPGEVAALTERLRRDAGLRAGHEEEEELSATGLSGGSEWPTAPAPRGSADRAGLAAGPVGRRRLRALAPYGFAAILLAAVIFGATRLGSRDADPSPAATERPEMGVDEIARAVARELDRRRRGDTAVRLPQHQTQSIAAYEHYLRGSDPAVLRSDSAARRALDHFRRAIELDSAYAAAWAGLARLSLRVGGGPVGAVPRREPYEVARQAALEAVALDDSLAEAHATLGLVRMAEFDLPAAERRLKRAIELEPSRALTREWLVSVYLWSGRPAEALSEAERALELDPLSSTANAEVARALLANGRCDEALARLDRLAALEPPLLRVPTIAAQCYARKRMWEEAIGIVRHAPDPDTPINQALLGYLLARAGRRDDALEIRDRLLEHWRQGDLGAFPVAVVQAGLDETDQAFTWIDRSIDDRSLMASPLHFTVMEPILERLRPDPRFERLSERLGLRVR